MFDENLDLFFTDFAVDVTLKYQDDTKTDASIKGIFEDPYAAAQLGSYRVVSTNPILLAKWSPDTSELVHNDTAVIDDVEYFVEGAPHNDGTGICRILLIDKKLNDKTEGNYVPQYHPLGEY